MTAVQAPDRSVRLPDRAPVVALRQLMVADAVVTAVGGLGLLAGASMLAEEAGLTTAAPVRAVGGFFVVLAVVVATVGWRPERTLVRLTSVNGLGDLMWAAASVIVGLTADLSGSGRAVVLVQAVIVLAVGEAKLLLARRARAD
jgi:hypothetical protein